MVLKMTRHSSTFFSFVLIYSFIYSAIGSAEVGQGGLRGRVTETSEGVLPGVSVVATSGDGKVVDTQVTDGNGEYVFRALPAGLVTLTFQLSGFETVVVKSVTVRPESDWVMPVERLRLAS